MAKESTSKTTKTTGKGFAAATQFPARAARTSKAAEKAAAGAAAPTDTPRFRSRKSKSAIQVAGEAMSKATKPRSGAAKRAEPTLAAKVASTQVKAAKKPAAKPVRQQEILKGPLTKASTIKTAEVSTIGQLNAKLAEFNMNSSFSLHGNAITVFNLRGREVGRITYVAKPVKKAASKK